MERFELCSARWLLFALEGYAFAFGSVRTPQVRRNHHYSTLKKVSVSTNSLMISFETSSEILRCTNFTVRESSCLLLTTKVMPAALTALMDEDVNKSKTPNKPPAKRTQRYHKRDGYLDHSCQCALCTLLCTPISIKTST